MIQVPEGGGGGGGQVILVLVVLDLVVSEWSVYIVYDNIIWDILEFGW